MIRSFDDVVFYPPAVLRVKYALLFKLIDLFAKSEGAIGDLDLLCELGRFPMVITYLSQ